MKIKEIILNNFAGISQFSTSLSDSITYFMGANGSGKTTIGVTAIWFILKGIAQRGDALNGKRIQFIGPNDTYAEGRLKLRDDHGEYIVTRRIQGNKQTLEIKSSDGRALGQDWIDSFWNDLLLSPVQFSKLDGKEQAKRLGIDVSEFDKQMEEVKDAAKVVRSRKKALGSPILPKDMPEPVPIRELLDKKNKIEQFNNKQIKIAADRAAIEQKINSKKVEVAEMMEKIKALNMEIDLHLIPEINAIPLPQKPVSSEDIDMKIEEANQISDEIANYRRIEDKIRQIEELDEKLIDYKSQVKRINNSRIEYIQSLDLPLTNISVSDSGELLFNGRPLKEPYFSRGEMIKACTLLLAHMNPEMRYVYLEEFDLLDPQKAEDVIKYLSGRDFQVVCELVAREKTDGVLVLKDEEAY